MDEVGHADLRASTDVNQRYLSLTGVIVSSEYHQNEMTSSLSALKLGVFGTDSVVLHRADIIKMNPPFVCLRDPAKHAKFDSGILQLLEDSPYTVLTATIDKLEHLERYTVWRMKSLPLLP